MESVLKLHMTYGVCADSPSVDGRSRGEVYRPCMGPAQQGLMGPPKHRPNMGGDVGGGVVKTLFSQQHFT